MKGNVLKESRRNFLKGGLALGGLSLLNPMIAVGQDVIDEKEFNIIAGPYLQTE